MILGTALSGLQYLALARISGLDGWIAAWVVASAVGDVFYWTLFHVVFARVGDAPRLGRQVSVRQIIAALASVTGPPVGGFLLMYFPPMVAFGAAAGLRMLSALPLFWIDELPFHATPPPGVREAARFGATLFVTDGWTNCTAGSCWAVMSFIGLGGRFDTLGFALAAAGLAGALAGFLLGRAVDLGRGRSAATINLAAAVSINIMQAIAGYDPARILLVMVAAAALSGLAAPAIMGAFYTQAKVAPCPLRFQYAAEGGWDVGAVCASLACALMAALGAPLQLAVLLAVPVHIVQARMLVGHYGLRAPGGAGRQALAPGD